MVLGFFPGTGNNAAVQYFGIRLEQKYIVFRGHEALASDVVLKGKVVLCNTEQLRIHDIRMKLTGSRHTSLIFPTAASQGYVKQDTEFLRHDWTFWPDGATANGDASNTGGSSNPRILLPGNHEWDFEYTMSGSLPESVEGNYSNWIVYRLKATVDRGMYARNIEARQPLRVLRTIDGDSMEILHGPCMSNTWPNKIMYEVSTPQKAVPLGGPVAIEADLIPLTKGLRIDKINTTFIEHQDITVEVKGEPLRRKQHDRVVLDDSFEVGDDVTLEDINGAEGYRISRELFLPRNLRACLQSVETKNIVIKHWVKCFITLRNSDGHLSELRVQLPMVVYIPPHANITSELALETSDINSNSDIASIDRDAPPLYGQHQLDVIYTQLDTRTYQTPVTSTLPSRAQSRRASVELHRFHDGTVGTNGAAQDRIQPLPTEISAHTLHARLAGLPAENTVSSSPPVLDPLREGEYFSVSNDAAGIDIGVTSADASGSGSADDQETLQQQYSREPEHIEWHMDALSRVPSYNTAVDLSATQTTRDHSGADHVHGLPDYAAATGTARSGSTPPSPRTPENIREESLQGTSTVGGNVAGERSRRGFSIAGLHVSRRQGSLGS